jgi:small nuclear ribonucleoprotein (snRNP)-like protein
MRIGRGAIVALLLAACMVGTSGREYAPARGPAGITVSLELAGDRLVRGELLAVEDSTLLVLQEEELVRVTLAAIHSGKAPKISFTGATLTPRTRERLRLVSRYPQGVPAELEERLLQAYGADSVGRVS